MKLLFYSRFNGYFTHTVIKLGPFAHAMIIDLTIYHLRFSAFPYEAMCYDHSFCITSAHVAYLHIFHEASHA